MKFIDNLQKFYSLLTSDLSIPEIMRRIKLDATSTYQYYVREAGDLKRSKKTNKPKFFNLIKNLFLVFIKKLTPARRIAYLAALILFFNGMNNDRQDTGNNKVVIGFLLMNILLAAELADKITAKGELDIARQIQIDLLPKFPPDTLEYEFAYRYESANTVSGDFYDFLKSPEGSGFVAMVGDISGKGMEAALHMVQVNTLIHSQPYPDDMRVFLNKLNGQLHSALPANQFLTASFLKVNNSRDMEFYRAGHLPLYHFQAIKNQCRTISPSGMGLAMADTPAFDKTLEKQVINVAAADILCFCTDGIVETENPSGEEFGESRLIEILIKYHRLPPQQIVHQILTAVAVFQDKAPRKDDLTLLIIKKN